MQHHWKGIGSYGSIGLEFVVSVLFGLFGGRWLDGKLGTAPWLMWIGLLLGVVAGYRSMFRALTQANRAARKIEEEERQSRKKFDDQARGPD